jgi:hypothetical protein
MKYILGTLAVACSILIFQNATSKSAWDSLKEFGAEFSNSIKGDMCVRQVHQGGIEVERLEKIFQENPSPQNLSALNSVLKNIEDEQKEMGCKKLAKKFSSDKRKEAFFSFTQKIENKADFYAEASGEPYLLLKIRRFFKSL